MTNGTKTKLKISPCDVKKGVAKVNKGETPFEAMINPSGYKYSSSIEYSKPDKKAMGAGIEKKFSRAKPDKVEFKELVLDGTGVVDNGGKAVKDQIALLRKVAYDYKGSGHEPPVVEVSWGTLLIQARLDSLNIDYTLFKPSGEPLRAKLSLTFFEYKSTEETYQEVAQQSPDLTHLVAVKAGDTLPMLCFQIYQDSSHYLAVARLNNLRQFRNLQPGQVLRFPPLV